MKKGTVLGIFAHPDDESFGPGGTLARCAAEGFDVHICIMTDGAAGTADPDFEESTGRARSLAERRQEELACAVETLGATLHTMGYRDSGMAGDPSNGCSDAFINQPLEAVAERLTALVRQLRPEIIITHDDTGGYYHPDHIYTHKAAWMAFTAAGKESAYPEQVAGGLAPWNAKGFYCHVIPRSLTRALSWIMRLTGKNPTHFGRNGDIDMTRMGKPANQIHVRIDVRRELPIKREAGACHSSQGGGSALHLKPNATLQDRISYQARQWFNRWECYQQLYPLPDGRRRGFFEIGSKYE